MGPQPPLAVDEAPLRVPVELSGGARWFRLAHAVSPSALLLGVAAPDELEGVITVSFCLPGDPRPLRCRARLEEQVVGGPDDERAERRRVRFLDLDEAERARLLGYVADRLQAQG